MFGIPEDDFKAIEFGLKIFGAIAVISTLYFTLRTHAERSTFEMIDRLYSLCHTLEAHLLRDWKLGHMLCIGVDEYEITKQMISSQLRENELAEYRIKEKLFAIHVFIVYEQVYYQWSNTSQRIHGKRRKFLGEMLAYFTDRFLCNPRLAWYLQEHPKGEGIHLEVHSRRYLDSVLARNPKLDPIGPYVPAQS